MTKNNILEKIKKGKVKMKPKIYFIWRGIFIAFSIIFITLFILYILSFIFFNLRLSGMWYLPRFGFPGFGALLVSSPWVLILIAIALIIILEVLVKRFSFAYRRPILYSILAIIVIVFLASFIIGKTQFHPELFRRAREGRLPVMGEFYRVLGSDNVHHGMISEITDNGFRIEKLDGQVIDVLITENTRFPSGTDFKQENMVVVFGKRDNGEIKAFGILKADREFRNLIRNHRPGPPRSMLFE